MVNDPNSQNLIKAIQKVLWIFTVILLLLGLIPLSLLAPYFNKGDEKKSNSDSLSLWRAPDTSRIPNSTEGNLIRYGRKLISGTSKYLGPKGTVKAISNGMNCQNCHLEAGTKPFGNNYGSVASTYPRYRDRSGSLESIEKRINDCIERSLNGKPMDSLSAEMRAMVSYIKWLGKDVPRGKKALGSGFLEIKFLSRAADSVNGQTLYSQKCVSCHMEQGEGLLRFNGSAYVYPPLWGESSFNVGAGLYRISNFAKYIHASMPQGATYKNPIITEEEAWDIAAYVLSMTRPDKDLSLDWPKLETKPVDHPFGPYADGFGEKQHKYGPFKEMIRDQKK